MGNARVFNSVMMGGLAQLVGGDADVWRSVIADGSRPKCGISMSGHSMPG